MFAIGGDMFSKMRSIVYAMLAFVFILAEFYVFNVGINTIILLWIE